MEYYPPCNQQHPADMDRTLLPMEIGDVQKLSGELEQAISEGHSQLAISIVKKLAEMRAAVNIHPVPPVTEKEISARIFIEDKDQVGTYVMWNLHPSMQIKTLKNLMFLSYQFHPDVQCWIIGRKLARDDSLTLRDCGINRDNSTLYLYLLARDKTQGELLNVVDADEMHQLELNALAAAQAVGPGDVPDIRDKVLEIAEDPDEQNFNLVEDNMSPSTSQAGWACPSCTYRNEPTRPGCEICATDRPADYQVPGDYKMSVNEKRRQEKEKTFDLLTQEGLGSNVEELGGLNLLQHEDVALALRTMLNQQNDDPPAADSE